MHFSLEDLEMKNNLITKQLLQWFYNAHHQTEKPYRDLNPQEKTNPKLLITDHKGCRLLISHSNIQYT